MQKKTTDFVDTLLNFKLNFAATKAGQAARLNFKLSRLAWVAHKSNRLCATGTLLFPTMLDIFWAGFTPAL